MFQVDVMKYCEGCPEFAPEAIKCPPVIVCEHIRKFFGLPDEE